MQRRTRTYSSWRRMNDKIDEVPMRGTRTLSHIYQRCNGAVMEPAGYNKAATDQEWIAAMKEELRMIEKNNTWESNGFTEPSSILVVL